MVHVVELTEREQEVLEGLWEEQVEGRAASQSLHEEAGALGLGGKGWVEGAGALLTEQGRELARKAIRRHRLAERLMVDVLNVAVGSAEEDACVLEHSLVAGLAEKVCTFLGHPRVCPHGHPIPEGACCRREADNLGPAVAHLAQLKPGESGTIAYLATPQGKDLQKFLSMGVHPGDSVMLVRRTPSIVFKCGHSQFAVDRALASQIYVRRES